MGRLAARWFDGIKKTAEPTWNRVASNRGQWQSYQDAKIKSINKKYMIRLDMSFDWTRTEFICYKHIQKFVRFADSICTSVGKSDNHGEVREAGAIRVE